MSLSLCVIFDGAKIACFLEIANIKTSHFSIKTYQNFNFVTLKVVLFV